MVYRLFFVLVWLDCIELESVHYAMVDNGIIESPSLNHTDQQ